MPPLFFTPTADAAATYFGAGRVPAISVSYRARSVEKWHFKPVE